ncbi:MAG TPA: hypothetical protein VFD92_10570 [Candidatus Binatia bacterium]|nr:hypothetical protein [Candidatus Binatia bacterium]
MKFRITKREDGDKQRPITPTVTVGSSIDAVCATCKRVTPHDVIRKVGALPTQVGCSVCHSEHPYKSPVALARSKERRAATVAAAAPPCWEALWTKAMTRAGGTAIPYSMEQRFAIGQRLAHPSFGEGVVTTIGSSTVCTVLFVSGERRLLMASPTRTASS